MTIGDLFDDTVEGLGSGPGPSSSVSSRKSYLGGKQQKRCGLTCHSNWCELLYKVQFCFMHCAEL